MSQTQPKQRFTELFGNNTDYEMPETDTNGILISEDTCVALVPPDREKIGICEFSEYSDYEGYQWASGEWKRQNDITESEHDLIVFDETRGSLGENTRRTCIDVQYLVRAAQLLDTDLEDIIERVQTYRNYPVVIPSQAGYIVISPLAIDDYELVNST